MNRIKHGIWVFGDYRNYFQNRVTLQIIARACELAPKIDADVSARDNNGRTPLSVALEGGCKEIADLLRRHGATE